MEILKILAVTVSLLLIAVAAMSIRMIFKKGGKFSGGSCKSSPELANRGITCGCGNEGECKSE